MEKADIRVFKLNESIVRIDTNPDINAELKLFFAARAHNYQFMPAYQAGQWDGYIRFYQYDNKLPIGLAYEDIDKFAKGGNYSLFANWVRENPVDINEDDWTKFIQVLQIPMEVRDYQFQSSYMAVTNQKGCIQLPTGSGKSLVMYIICRWLQLNDKKTLVIVPRQNLVEQLYGDFIDYGWNDTAKYVHRIYSGKEKIFEKPIVVTTWQSVFREKEIFEQFDCLMIDEAHGAKAKSLMDVAKKCINAEWRIGLSGTYPNNQADVLSVTGALGPIKDYANYQKLRDEGYLAPLQIKNLFLKYHEKVRQTNFNLNFNSYHSEVAFINLLEVRNKFLVKLANKMEKNTFILFTMKAHGRELERMMQAGPKRIFYIDGSIKVDERELIRRTLEIKDDIVLVASFGTFKMGVNVKNVHNIIFASNYKSKITVLQSIGRGLRSRKGKEKVVIYDVIDDLQQPYFDNGREKVYYNYSMRHYVERKKIYREQGFDEIENFNIQIR